MDSFITERVSYLVPRIYSLATIDNKKARMSGGKGWDCDQDKMRNLTGWKELAFDEFDILRCAYPDESPEIERTYKTALVMVSLLKRELGKEIKNRSSEFRDIASSRAAAVIAGNLGDFLSDLFTPYTRKRNLEYRKRIKVRTESDDSFIKIKAAPYFDRAKAFLDDCESNILKNSDWVAVSVSLALLTGRRMSEIHHSAKVELSGNEGTVLFTGQLKGKSRRSGGKLLINTEFEIPVLGSPEQIIHALQWLEDKGKRLKFNGKDIEDKNLTVNQKWGGQLSKEIRANWDFLQHCTAKTHPKLTEAERKATYHKMRGLYAAELLRQWHDSSPHSHRTDQKLMSALCDGSSEAVQSYKRYVVVN